jgi:hypothetical protein
LIEPGNFRVFYLQDEGYITIIWPCLAISVIACLAVDGLKFDQEKNGKAIAECDMIIRKLYLGWTLVHQVK